MKRAAIPVDNREYPDYEYRPYPRWIGRDEFGQDLVATSEEDAKLLAERRVYPKLLGLDMKGNKVEALHPDEVAIKKTWVVRKAEDVVESGNKLTSSSRELEDENARLRAELEKLQRQPEPEKPAGKKKAA